VLAIGLAATSCSATPSASSASPTAAAGSPPSSTSSNVSALNSDLGLGNAAAPGSAAPPDPLGPPKDPFTGTPADNWADGAAGIVLPKAEPVGGYTAQTVESAYEITKKLLVAAYLNQQTLLGGPPTAFEDLLSAAQLPWFKSNLNKKGLDKQGYPVSSRTMVMSFAPGDAQLIGSVIKVHGTMSAQAAEQSGQPVLDIKIDYIFVYPVEPPGHPTEWMRIVSEAVWSVDFGNWQGDPSPFEPWVQTTGGDDAGGFCGEPDGYTHPDYPNSGQTAPNPSDSPTGTPVNPYALSGPRQTETAGCTASTGT
jgi:hypothetical protein